MLVRLPVALAIVVCCAAVPAHAAPIQVDFLRAALTGPVNVDLPLFLDSSNEAVFLSFSIPDAASIASINSFSVSVSFFDDDDVESEAGSMSYVRAGGDLALGGFGGLNGTTSFSPFTLTGSFVPSTLALLTTEIGGGVFRIRVQRESGDFLVLNASAAIDAELTAPEPPTLGFAGAGMLFGAIYFIFARRSIRTRST
jgi:hypothetical protein